MKNVILPFLVMGLLGIGACDDSTINPPSDKKDTTVIKDSTDSLKVSIQEDIVFVNMNETGRDSVGEQKYFLYAINKDNSGLRTIMQLPSRFTSFALSPDRSNLLVIADRKLYKINIENQTTEFISDDASAVKWLPDSKQFVYIYDDEHSTCWISNGTNKSLIIDWCFYLPAIMPDGKNLLHYQFATENNVPPGIYSINTSDYTKTLLVKRNDISEYTSHIHISSDAKRIAYVMSTETEYKLILSNIDGSNLQVIMRRDRRSDGFSHFVLTGYSSKEKFLVGVERHFGENIYGSETLEVNIKGEILSSFSTLKLGVAGGGSWSKDGVYYIQPTSGSPLIVNSVTKERVNLNIGAAMTQWVE